MTLPEIHIQQVWERQGDTCKDFANLLKDIKMQIDRRGVETFPITIEQHIDLLRRSGFRSADILWASYLQAGFLAIK